MSKSRRVIDKKPPGLSSDPQIDMARSMTSKQIQQFKPDLVADETLAHIDTALVKLPARK